jgi:polyhydroxyalkanoate synthesis regulator phasin
VVSSASPNRAQVIAADICPWEGEAAERSPTDQLDILVRNGEIETREARECAEELLRTLCRSEDV